MIVFSLYPHVFIDWIHEHGSKLRPGTIITDVTGVKGCVVYEIQKSLPKGVEFIAAHPMAGRESSGIEYSDDRIFRGANYIVVPTEANSERAIEMCKALGETLGCKDISILDVASHDRMIAFLSQLTHCIAVSLMCACDAPDLERYTGDSFRDLTRIANINDEMWSELFLANKDALLREMDAYRACFDELRDTIASGDREKMREMIWHAAVCHDIGKLFIVETIITHVTGKQLARLQYQQQMYAANYRFALVRVRECSEQIALLRGEDVEHGRLMRSFGDIIVNQFRQLDVQPQVLVATPARSLPRVLR